MTELRARTEAELKTVLDELVNSVQTIFGDSLKKVILFGSYARGDFDAESDIDVMILVKEDEAELKRYFDTLSDIMVLLDLKYDVLIADIVQDYHKFNKYINVLPFYQHVQNEGIVIYERTTACEC
jgi:predicted nucleotidyltransferase